MVDVGEGVIIKKNSFSKYIGDKKTNKIVRFSEELGIYDIKYII